jgi:hypothetical protein
MNAWAAKTTSENFMRSKVRSSRVFLALTTVQLAIKPPALLVKKALKLREMFALPFAKRLASLAQ